MKFIGTQNIETDRLLLRRLTVKDAKEAYENWCSNYNVSKYVLWKKHENVEETRKLFELWEKEYEDSEIYRWIVEIKETKELIGTIDVTNKKFMKYGTCEIGYCYSEKSWGRGYATEALKRVIKFLFEECDAKLVCAEHLSLNPASGKVMAKSGMVYEGTKRSRLEDADGIRNDLLIYSITRDEYELTK